MRAKDDNADMYIHTAQPALETSSGSIAGVFCSSQPYDTGFRPVQRQRRKGACSKEAAPTRHDANQGVPSGRPTKGPSTRSL
jgi:hypothetical protein